MYLFESLSRPTRLYIKQCPVTLLKYFGKSILEDIVNYPGSGTYWTRHLKKHNSEPLHLWNSDWYYDTSVVRFALKFSHINKIVESKDWANLVPENGLDGGYTGPNFGQSKPPWTGGKRPDHSLKMSGENNPMFGGHKPESIEKMKINSNRCVVSTPDGIFPSAKAAAQHFGVSSPTIFQRCTSQTERMKDWFIIEKLNMPTT